MSEFKEHRIAGFRLIKTEALPDYKAEGFLYEHEKTGFQVYFVKNDDNERFFSYTVYTPPANSKGIAHIIEHTVLAGSEKYPVKDPFMILVRNSCNTFLNAMTGVDRTYYPAASTVIKDFDNLFSVYTDAVFSPLLREETFMQEGVRISSEGGMHFEGVVFSEMLGEMAEHGFVLSSASTKPLFSSSAYRCESGGDAREICDLGYDEYLEQWRRFYVPANIHLFLYGSLDPEEYLEKLDREYLCNRDGGMKVERIGLSERWTEPRSYYTESNAEDDSGKSSVMVSWLLSDGAVPGESTFLSLVVDILLGSPGCPLYKAVAESDLGDDLSPESGMSSSYRELTFTVGFSGADKENAGRIEEYILSSLGKIVHDGLDRKAVEAAIRRMEFSLKEIPGGMPKGMRLFFQAEKAITFSTDTAKMLSPSWIIGEIRKRWEAEPRLFENWIQENLIDNSHRLLTVVAKEKGHAAMIDEEIERVLQKRLGEYSEGKERAFNEFQNMADSEENIARVPRLSSKDIPAIIERIPHEIEGNLIRCPMTTGGIVYTDILFDITDFSEEEMDDAVLLSRLLSMCSADGMDYAELQTELRFVSGGYAFYVESGSDSSGNAHVFFVCRLKSLPGLEADGLRLFDALLQRADLKDEKRIRAALSDIITDYQSSVVQSGQSYAMAAAASSLSVSGYIGERLTGLTYWYTANAMLSSDLSLVSERLIALRERLFVQKRAILHVTAEKEDMDGGYEAAKAFIGNFPPGESAGACSLRIQERPPYYAFALSSSVSFLGIAGTGAGFGSEEAASERIMLSMLSSTVLWGLIREMGGAYGTGIYLDTLERMWSFYSYRDPRGDESIRDFLSSPQLLDPSERDLEDAVIAEMSRSLRPSVPAVKSLTDLRRIVYGISDDERERQLNAVLSLTPSDIIRASECFKARLDSSRFRVAWITDRKKAESSELPFEIIGLPG